MTTSDVVQRFLQHLAQRNIDAIADNFADTVDWYIPGDTVAAPWTGKRSTRAEVKTFFEELWANTEPLSAEIEHMLIDGTFAVITGAFSSRMLKTDTVVDSPFCIQITVEDGLIARYSLLEDSHAVSVAMRS